MLDPSRLNPMLLATEPLPVGDTNLMATTSAHGQYIPLSFVLRLSPLVHQAMAALPRSGIVTSGEIGLDGAQAFSTYLHETVHWWQHIGSTYGLMSSLSYPAQTHGNYKHIKQLISMGELKKSIGRIAETAIGKSGPGTLKGISNIITNNHFDIGAFSRFSYNQEFARSLALSKMFENLGHFMHLSYAHNLVVLSGVNDKDFKTLPDPRGWEAEFRKLRERKVEGFYYGSRIGLWPIGAREIMEGQASFCQMQYLHFASGGRFEWDDFRSLGILHGVYELAFKEFLRTTQLEWPSSINHPTVALFMLLCDMALNPGSGFPFDPSPHFESFIDDTIPGIRFTSMATHIRLKAPELFNTISQYSRNEYEQVSSQIAKIMLDASPLEIARKCSEWASGPMSPLMEEYRTYEYGMENNVARVLLSHFLAFMQDKLSTPEFFCWPGHWMAGDNVMERAAVLFDRHGALFVDREEDTGIYPRLRDGYTEAQIQKVFDDFYASVVIYEMTDQLIKRAGPFVYNYDWLKPSATPAEFKSFADRQFQGIYDVAPDDIPII